MLSLTDLRQYRIGPFAIFDTVTAYLGILILSPLLTWLFSKIHRHVPLASWLWLTIPISVIFHLIFAQNTPLMTMLSDPYKVEFYLVLIVLALMTYMGLSAVKSLPQHP